MCLLNSPVATTLTHVPPRRHRRLARTKQQQSHIIKDFIKNAVLTNNGCGRGVLLRAGPLLVLQFLSRLLGRDGWLRHWTSSLAAAATRLQAVLVAGSALEGFERIREAVAEHGHLAAMAHRARNEGKVPTGLAHVGLLDPLKKNNCIVYTSSSKSPLNF